MNKKDLFDAESINSLIARIESAAHVRPSEYEIGDGEVRYHLSFFEAGDIVAGFNMSAYVFDDCGYPACLAGHACSLLHEREANERIVDDRGNEVFMTNCDAAEGLTRWIAEKSLNDNEHVALIVNRLAGHMDCHPLLDDITPAMAIDALKQVRDTGDFAGYQ